MELMKPELERDPIWRTIPCAKEILVQKGIANRGPWENIQGGTEILESLGYTEYTGFALQFPRNIIPDMFADHIGNLTVELVLASAEVKFNIFHFFQKKDFQTNLFRNNLMSLISGSH